MWTYGCEGICGHVDMLDVETLGMLGKYGHVGISGVGPVSNIPTPTKATYKMVVGIPMVRFIFSIS